MVPVYLRVNADLGKAIDTSVSFLLVRKFDGNIVAGRKLPVRQWSVGPCSLDRQFRRRWFEELERENSCDASYDENACKKGLFP